MKSTLHSLALMAAAGLLATGCGQSGSTTEQPATAPTEQSATPGSAAPDSAAAPDAAAAATPAAPAAETLEASFRFKPVTGAEADPSQPRSTAVLVLKGKETKEIDLGRFIGKPDQVSEENAKRAGFPAGMLLGFRSYDPNSGTGDDLAVLQGQGGRLRILQRRTDETDSEPRSFQTAREIPMPAGTQLKAAPIPAKKK